MFDPTDILVHVHPVFRISHFGRGFSPRRGEPSEIPRRIDKRIHRVGFALGRFAAFRAGHIAPCRVPVQRIAGNVKAHVIRQADG